MRPKEERTKIKRMEFEIKLLSPSAVRPKKSTRGAIGYDLVVPRDYHVPAHSRVAVPLDIAINLPYGIEAKIEPRSGNSVRGIEGYGSKRKRVGKWLGLFPKYKEVCGRMRFDADVLVGKIDPNYTDGICVIISNHDESFVLRAGSRVAQLTFYNTISPFFKEVDELTCKSRGGGFGSTGTMTKVRTEVISAPEVNLEEEEIEEQETSDQSSSPTEETDDTTYGVHA
jgi:dUTP pyrophosphatase